MTYRFTIIKRVLENNSLIAFIDLLGTLKLYRNTFAEDQAQKTLRQLLEEFDVMFSEHFSEKEINENFDISIFSDSIVISQRKKTYNFIKRLVDLLLHYQGNLLLNLHSPSRAIVVKDSFFSFKIAFDKVSPKSILGSPNTNISLCGGKGIAFANNSLKGLPIGVYVTDKVIVGLSAEQKGRAIPIKNESLFFIRQKHGVECVLPNETLDLLCKRPTADKNSIRDTLKGSFSDEDALRKFLPWIMVHLGREKEIVRLNKL